MPVRVHHAPWSCAWLNTFLVLSSEACSALPPGAAPVTNLTRAALTCSVPQDTAAVKGSGRHCHSGRHRVPRARNYPTFREAMAPRAVYTQAKTDPLRCVRAPSRVGRDEKITHGTQVALMSIYFYISAKGNTMRIRYNIVKNYINTIITVHAKYDKRYFIIPIDYNTTIGRYYSNRC